MLAVLTTLVVLGSLGESADTPTVTVEFRRAESKPAEGLTEAKVNGKEEKVYLHKAVEITNADIKSAKISKDTQGQPALELIFTEAGAKKFARVTAAHKDKLLAVLIDGQVVSAPLIREAITDKAVITGDFKKSELEKLVQALNKK